MVVEGRSHSSISSIKKVNFVKLLMAELPN